MTSIPGEGLTLDGYRRLVYGVECPGCHKPMRSRVVARRHARGWPVLGKPGLWWLSAACGRSPCRMRTSLEKLLRRMPEPEGAQAPADDGGRVVTGDRPAT